MTAFLEAHSNPYYGSSTLTLGASLPLIFFPQIASHLCRDGAGLWFMSTPGRRRVRPMFPDSFLTRLPDEPLCSFQLLDFRILCLRPLKMHRNIHPVVVPKDIANDDAHLCI
ncbi:hypothetical protein J3459_015774 [Metarhizium acridum]|uniref:uncharacterized protein n=1 Tax=Metarhizium acridum TaxID=92637 RepID=UPI001C6ACA86|nr:hypothetical protein J3459_015774 [Metarhizium acridum]KAG8421963.1 hypothetical protein J3458_003792 [Metarhizium acridum]KAG8421971.1 hypothetical protein J3458_003800 [Metarhizium acridum]